MEWRQRYPGYDVMSQRGHWDAATRRVVLDRVHNLPAIQYFSADEARLLQAICDRILPQDDRPPDRRIPVVPFIDQRCRERITDGVRYADMPDDWLAWRHGLAGVDETSRERYGRSFVELDAIEKDAVLDEVRLGHPPGRAWAQMPARRFFFAILIRQICSVYYAHPTAWNEIGFGGPAFPRGYMALNFGRPEPWEVDEAR